MASKLKARRVIAPKVVTQGNAARTVVVAKAAKSYVAHRPDTRIPALLLVMLFPLGELGHSMGWSALWLALAAPVVGVAAWTAVSKQYGKGSYARIVTATLSLVPVWLAAAAVLGIFHLRVLVCYSVAAVILWVAYARSEIITERRRFRQAKIDWHVFAPKVGLAGADLRETRQTRLGEEYKVDVLGTGKRASQLVTPALGETWAMHRSLPSESRIVVQIDPRNARQILVEERTREPWKEPNGHPTLHPDVEWKLPTRRSIHDGPLEVGADPTSGNVLSLPVYAERSCKHVLVIATTGGGKTVLVCCIVERVTACTDTLVWAIDTTKGTLSGLWREAIDWGAGVGEHAKALTILRAAKTVIEERSKLSDGENHHATPTAPLIFLLVDEAGSMQGGMTTRQAAEYRELLGFVFRSARSAGIVMVFISQRGVIQHTGTGDARANAAIRVCLRVESTGEMEYAIPDWQAQRFPDMSKYAEGYAGVVAIQAPGQRPSAGRSWDLSNFAEVRQLAARRGAPAASLEPAIAAMLGQSYASRRGVLVAAGSVPVLALEEEPSVPDEFDSITAALADIDKSCDTLAAMQIPEADRMPMKDLIAARAEIDAEDRKTEVPDIARVAVLGAIAEAAKQGKPGLSRADLVRLLGELLGDKAKPRTVERWLRRLVLDGVVARSGATSNALYVLPEPCA